MINLLRMDFYRLLKGKMLMIGICIMVAMIAFMTGMAVFVESEAAAQLIADGTLTVTTQNTSSSDATDSNSSQTAITGSDQIKYMNASFFAGGSTSIVLCILATLFIVTEFECGFAKNVFSIRFNRGAYFASKVIVVFVLTIALMLFSIALSLLGATICGFDLVASPFSEWVQWFCLGTLVLFAYELILIAMVLITRNKVIAIIAAVLLSFGIIGNFLTMLITQLMPGSEIYKGILFTSFMAVGNGETGIEALGLTVILTVGLAYALVFGIAGFIALKKRDVY